MYRNLVGRSYLCSQLVTIISDRLVPTIPSAQILKLSRSLVNCQRNKMSTSCNQQQHIHQETLRYVNPLASVRIESDIPVRVRTCNVHDYPNADVLIAELHGIPVGNCPTTMQVEVSPDEKLVDVNVKKVNQNIPNDCNFHCELIIPLRASLFMSRVESVIAENLLSENVTIKASRSIRIRNVRSERIQLTTFMGDIHCEGTFLGNESYLRTYKRGRITLNKIQGGNKFHCQTENGNVNVDCCYANFSTFESDSGHLNLNNIHKSSKVFIHRMGSLNMSGFHGNLQVHMKKEAGFMNIYLSELNEGESSIRLDGGEWGEEVDNVQHGQCNSPSQRQRFIQVSDKIEETTAIDIEVNRPESRIVLEESLQHFDSGLNETHQRLHWPTSSTSSTHKHNGSYLKITSADSICVGKSSWLNTIRNQIMKKNLSTNGHNE